MIKTIDTWEYEPWKLGPSDENSIEIVALIPPNHDLLSKYYILKEKFKF